MLDFFMNVQQSSGGGGGAGGYAFNGDGNPPVTPTHYLMQPVGSYSGPTFFSGFMIWDVTNPASPSIASTYRVGTSTYSSTANANDSFPRYRTLCVKGGVAYMDSYVGPYLYSFDVSNPSTFGAGNLMGSISGIRSSILVAAHPTKDILWTVDQGTKKIRTIDISNPASMSVILEITCPSAGPVTGATISFDGEYLFVRAGIYVFRYTLNASNEPSSETSFSLYAGIGASGVDSISYAEGASGDKFLIYTSGTTNILGISELDGSYNQTSSWNQSGASLYDDTRMALPMPYGSNYTSDDLSILYYEEDDADLNITTTSPAVSNTFNHRAVVYDATYISTLLSSYDVFDQYVFTVYGNSRNFGVFEWSALNTFSRISGLNGSTTPQVSEATNKAVLFAP